MQAPPPVRYKVCIVAKTHVPIPMCRLSSTQTTRIHGCYIVTASMPPAPPSLNCITTHHSYPRGEENKTKPCMYTRSFKIPIPPRLIKALRKADSRMQKMSLAQGAMLSRSTVATCSTYQLQHVEYIPTLTVWMTNDQNTREKGKKKKKNLKLHNLIVVLV